MQSQDTARSLARRCHHGNLEALRALLLHAADGLYSAALAASVDEAQAQELSVQAWETYLAGLGRGRPGESAEVALQRALTTEITSELNAAAAQRAVRLWSEAEMASLLPAPPLLVERLQELSTLGAPIIQRRAHRRRIFVWAGRAVAAVWLIVLLALGAQATERLLSGRARQVQFAALRERVQTERLTWAVRDALLDLPDPQGADRYQASLLAQVELLLEDIVADPSLGAADLRPLQQRLAQDALLWRLREVAQDAPQAQHASLSRVTLLLEEAQNL